MAVFTLKKEESLMLMIDIQEKLLPSITGKEVIEKTGTGLLKCSEILDIPLLYTEQYPKGLGETVKPLADLIPSASLYLSKTHFCCNLEPGFEELLGKTNRSQIILFGIESHICVLSTILELLKTGFEVAVVADGCGSRDRANHELAMKAMSDAGALVIPKESVIYQLLGKAGTPEFKAILPLIK